MGRGLPRYAAKRDLTEKAIVEALARIGATVQPLSIADAPDLLVGFRGVNYLLECKTRHGQLRANQVLWSTAWNGRPPEVVRSVEEALRAVGAID